jgi:hypothetical protein
MVVIENSSKHTTNSQGKSCFTSNSVQEVIVSIKVTYRPVHQHQSDPSVPVCVTADIYRPQLDPSIPVYATAVDLQHENQRFRRDVEECTFWTTQQLSGTKCN